MEQDKVSKLSDAGKNVWDEEGDGRGSMEQTEQIILFRFPRADLGEGKLRPSGWLWQ